MAYQVKEIATKADSVDLTYGTHVAEGAKQYSCAVGHESTHMHTQKINECNDFKKSLLLGNKHFTLFEESYPGVHISRKYIISFSISLLKTIIFNTCIIIVSWVTL